MDSASVHSDIVVTNSYMAEEALANFGLFIDSENRIRLIDPERITDSNQLRDDCKDFTESKYTRVVDHP